MCSRRSILWKQRGSLCVQLAAWPWTISTQNHLVGATFAVEFLESFSLFTPAVKPAFLLHRAYFCCIAFRGSARGQENTSRGGSVGRIDPRQPDGLARWRAGSVGPGHGIGLGMPCVLTQTWIGRVSILRLFHDKYKLCQSCVERGSN